MADFMAFGRGTLDIAKSCGSSLDKKETALFLVAQQKAIQDDRVKTRLSAPQNQGTKPGPSGSGATSALERMRAMMGKK